MNTDAAAVPRTVDLEALEAKIDYLVARHEMLEDLIREFTPVAREVVRVGQGKLGAWEDQGLFELLAALGDRAVPLARTLVNLTEPDVLAVANEAGQVIHHAADVRPVGMFGAVRATSDPEVQHGLAVALEVLRHLGRARAEHVSLPPTSPGPTPAPAPARVVAPAELAPKVLTARAQVTWEGVAFWDDGFLVDPATWSEDLATKMAAGLGLELTDEHWTVLRWIRADHAASGASPNVRRTATGSGVGTKRMYELFPRTPGKTAAMLAGVPKPVGCV